MLEYALICIAGMNYRPILREQYKNGLEKISFIHIFVTFDNQIKNISLLATYILYIHLPVSALFTMSVNASMLSVELMLVLGAREIFAKMNIVEFVDV